MRARPHGCGGAGFCNAEVWLGLASLESILRERGSEHYSGSVSIDCTLHHGWWFSPTCDPSRADSSSSSSSLPVDRPTSREKLTPCWFPMMVLIKAWGCPTLSTRLTCIIPGWERCQGRTQEGEDAALSLAELLVLTSHKQVLISLARSCTFPDSLPITLLSFRKKRWLPVSSKLAAYLIVNEEDQLTSRKQLDKKKAEN